MFYRNKKLLILFSIALLILSLIFVSKVSAVSVSVINFPNEIKGEAFTVTASISGASLGQNYLRVDLYKEDTSNYFGETFNGSDWYGGSEGKSYLPVNIDSSKIVLATITARIGEPEANEYPGSGTYKLKLRRYTSSGNQASDQQIPADILINFFLPSPEPTVTPTPTSQSVPTATPKPTTSSTPSPSPFSSVFWEEEATDEPIFEEVLAKASESATLGALITPLETIIPGKKEIVLSARDNKIAIILIALGVVFISACVILFFWTYIKNKKQNE